MIGATCACGRIHTQSEVVALGRFLTDQPMGFIARCLLDGDPKRTYPYVRHTRVEAQLDICPHWTTHSPGAASQPAPVGRAVGKQPT